MTDTTVEAPATPRLKVKYNEQIIPELEKEFKYSNPMQVARVQKVVVSMGVGAAARDSKLIEGAVKDLTLITGQKPKITKAKKSVAQFHLREGQAIGCIRHSLELYGMEKPDITYYCTLRAARKTYSFGCNSLDYLCDQFKIPYGQHHRAGDDAEMCARLFLQELEDAGCELEEMDYCNGEL